MNQLRLVRAAGFGSATLRATVESCYLLTGHRADLTSSSSFLCSFSSCAHFSPFVTFTYVSYNMANVSLLTPLLLVFVAASLQMSDSSLLRGELFLSAFCVCFIGCYQKFFYAGTCSIFSKPLKSLMHLLRRYDLNTLFVLRRRFET